MALQHKSDEDQKRLIAHFQGRVQGVGFRYSVVSIAQSHPVCGWIKNEWDGTVQMEVEGRQEDIEEFIREIYRSRLGPHIGTLSQQWSHARGEFTGFRIKQ